MSRASSSMSALRTRPMQPSVPLWVLLMPALILMNPQNPPSGDEVGLNADPPDRVLDKHLLPVVPQRRRCRNRWVEVPAAHAVSVRVLTVGPPTDGIEASLRLAGDLQHQLPDGITRSGNAAIRAPEQQLGSRFLFRFHRLWLSKAINDCRCWGLASAFLGVRAPAETTNAATLRPVITLVNGRR